MVATAATFYLSDHMHLQRTKKKPRLRYITMKIHAKNKKILKATERKRSHTKDQESDGVGCQQQHWKLEGNEAMPSITKENYFYPVILG